tara:strand:- start:201 stop:1700 length:1500 start_codon:yes stop_codon:yes gene_type:complete
MFKRIKSAFSYKAKNRLKVLSKILGAPLLLITLLSCETTNYSNTVLDASSLPSANSNSPIGYGPFHELLVDFSQDSKNVYVTPFLPKKYQERFRECYGFIPKDEKIYSFINGNTFSSGCNGIVFTSKGVHSNPASMAFHQGKVFLPYSTLYDSQTYYKTLGAALQVNSGAISFNAEMDESIVFSIFLEARRRSTIPAYQNYIEAPEPFRINTMPSEVFALMEISKNEQIEDVYLNPNISSRDIKRYRKCFELEQNQEIILLFKGAKFLRRCNGFAFLNDGVTFFNTFDQRTPGLFFIPYTQFIESTFTPYLTMSMEEEHLPNFHIGGDCNLVIDKGVIYDACPLGEPLKDSTPNAEFLVSLIKGLRGKSDITNSDAEKLARRISQIPLYEEKGDKKRITYKEKKSKQQRESESSNFWTNLVSAVIGVYIANEIYEEIAPDPCTPDIKVKSRKTQYAVGGKPTIGVGKTTVSYKPCPPPSTPWQANLLTELILGKQSAIR